VTTLGLRAEDAFVVDGAARSPCRGSGAHRGRAALDSAASVALKAFQPQKGAEHTETVVQITTLI
jgi:hypothetical protein